MNAAALSTENAINTQASVLDRLQSIVVKLKELEQMAAMLPPEARLFHRDLQRLHHFSWQLLKDLQSNQLPHPPAQ